MTPFTVPRLSQQQRQSLRHDQSTPPNTPDIPAPAATNDRYNINHSPSPQPASRPLLGSSPSSVSSRKAAPLPRTQTLGVFPLPSSSLTRTYSLPDSGAALGMAHSNADLRSGGRASPRTVAMFFSSLGWRGSPQRQGSYQSLGKAAGLDEVEGEDEEHLLDDLEPRSGWFLDEEPPPHPISCPIPIAKSILNRHSSRNLSSSCPTRASPLTNTPAPLHPCTATNTARGVPGWGEGGGLSASMTPTNATLAGANTTSSRPTPPGPQLPFSSNPLTPLTPNTSSTSSSTPHTTAATAAAAAAAAPVVGKPSLDRYAALKDLDEEFKIHKDNDTASTYTHTHTHTHLSNVKNNV